MLKFLPPKPSIPIPDPPPTPKAPYAHLRSSTPKQSPSHPYQALHTHPWLPHYSLALYTHYRPSTPVPGSPHPPHTLHTHPRPSIPPYAIQIISRSPSRLIPPHSHPSGALHTHQSLQYPSQALLNHLKPFKPISGPPLPPKALHIHLRPSTPT